MINKKNTKKIVSEKDSFYNSSTYCFFFVFCHLFVIITLIFSLFDILNILNF